LSNEAIADPSLAYVLAGGLIAGAPDILYAYAFWTVKSQIPAQRIFQSVAAGLLGDASFHGGWRTAALGMTPHFAISITTAVVYYLVALRWSLLWRQPLLSGMIYGLLVYGVRTTSCCRCQRRGRARRIRCGLGSASWSTCF
jgi:ribose/xylose/arabinose/galactoside ABC-type transport system permease subunit